jgi:carbamoyltransferase
MLAEGKIIGWFQGKMEFGPRALGNRSILADPRNAAMKDIVNKKVKHREPFRPFAPSVLEERSGEYFEIDCASPFMLLVCRVKEGMRSRIPATVHVDGTARLHTVRRDWNPRFYDLIREFGRLTAVPVVLNTSFNVRGEPIVCTPEDAIRCFLGTQMDALFLDRFLIEKR